MKGCTSPRVPAARMVTWGGMAAASPLSGGVESARSPVEAGELSARRDAELLEHLAQVVVDGPRTEEQPAGDLPVGRPLGDHAGDLVLLGGEVVERARVALARRLVGGAQLGGGPPLPRGGAGMGEEVER